MPTTHSATPHPPGIMRDTMRLALAAALLGSLFGILPLGLAPANAAEPTQIRIGAQAYGSTQRLEIGLDKSLIVDLPGEAREVIVSQPGVAGAIMRSKRRAIIQGVGAGDTNIFFLDAAGEPIAVLDLTVRPQRSDVASILTATLARTLPGSSIVVDAIDDGGAAARRVVLSGTAQSQDDIDKAIAIAAQFAGGEANVASVIATSAPQQVALKVTIAEVNREVIKQLGINIDASYTAGGLTVGLLSSQPLGGASQLSTFNGVGVSGTVGGLTIDATLRALNRQGAVRTLAEPTLTAMSGQEAEFLAGGRFPIPTGIDEGQITFTYQEFGARLKFTPTVKSNGSIALTVDTSVSEPTPEGSLTAGSIIIPGIKDRQAKTSVELRAGDTLAIGGLFQESVRTQINRIPGLGDIPIIGALFRSRDYIHSKTELVVLVTPYLAVSSAHADLPTDHITFAGDAEAIFLGRIESVYAVGPGGMRGSYKGSVGFEFD